CRFLRLASHLGRLAFFDNDHVPITALDNPLHAGELVAGREHEALEAGAGRLVVLQRQRQGGVAADPAALADEGGQLAGLPAAGELQPAIEAALAAEEPVVVDLCAVSFLDSTGLYALLVLRRRLLEQSRRVAIACWPSGAVAMTLAVSGTDQVFNVYESRAAA